MLRTVGVAGFLRDRRESPLIFGVSADNTTSVFVSVLCWWMFEQTDFVNTTFGDLRPILWIFRVWPTGILKMDEVGRVEA